MKFCSRCKIDDGSEINFNAMFVKFWNVFADIPYNSESNGLSENNGSPKVTLIFYLPIYHPKVTAHPKVAALRKWQLKTIIEQSIVFECFS